MPAPTSWRGCGDWLPKHKVNQKRVDAIAMLQPDRRRLRCQPNEPRQVDFDFQHTIAWDAILHRFAGSEDGGVIVDREELLDELRLTPGAYRRPPAQGPVRALAGRAGRPAAELEPTMRAAAERAARLSPRGGPRLAGGAGTMDAGGGTWPR